MRVRRLRTLTCSANVIISTGILIFFVRRMNAVGGLVKTVVREGIICAWLVPTSP